MVDDRVKGPADELIAHLVPASTRLLVLGRDVGPRRPSAEPGERRGRSIGGAGRP